MHTRRNQPVIAVTNGDPAGIGPEITLKALADPEVRAACAPVVIGSPELFARDLSLAGTPAGAPLSIRLLTSLSEVEGDPGIVEILPFDHLDLSLCPIGEVSAEGGRYSGASIRAALDLAMRGEAHAVVVSPNNKKALHDAGHAHSLEQIGREVTGSPSSIQIIIGAKYRFAKVTHHVPLRKVADLCTREAVFSAIRALRDGLVTLGIPDPVIGVSGLNPHNGEGGLCGDEESIHIGPACEDARKSGVNTIGPVPADTVFHDWNKFGFDAILSMYHDHGNAVMKVLEFGAMENFIGGLPVPLFTVMHGTAFDLAGKGLADPANMKLVLLAAARSKRLSR